MQKMWKEAQKYFRIIATNLQITPPIMKLTTIIHPKDVDSYGINEYFDIDPAISLDAHLTCEVIWEIDFTHSDHKVTTSGPKILSINIEGSITASDPDYLTDSELLLVAERLKKPFPKWEVISDFSNYTFPNAIRPRSIELYFEDGVACVNF